MKKERGSNKMKQKEIKKVEKVEWGVNQVENRKEKDKERKNRSGI